MKLSPAPVVEFGLGKVVGSSLDHEIVQLLKHPPLNREAPTERLIEPQIPID
jgi:hypothetical protein